MADQLDWDGDGAIAHVRSQAVAFLRRAAMEVVRRAKELLSVSGDRGQVEGTKGHRKGSRIYGAVRSAPGEPPRKQTGRLRASVTSEVDEASIGTASGPTCLYGQGPRNGHQAGHRPAPWLRRALAEMQARANQLLG